MMPTCYALHMRTTISLDDRLASTVRRRAEEEGLSVSAFIAGVLRDAVTRPRPRVSPPFRLVTVKGGGPTPDVDLDRPRTLEVEEDRARFGARSGDR